MRTSSTSTTASRSAPRSWCCLLPSVAPRPGSACSTEYRVASRNRTFCDGHHIGMAPVSISTYARRAGRLFDSPNPRAVLTYAEPGTYPALLRGFLFQRASPWVAGWERDERWPINQSAANGSRFPVVPSVHLG